MRRPLVLLTILVLVLMVFGSSSVLNSKAKEMTVVAQAPGTRCTHLKFGPRPKKSKRTTKSQAEAASGTPAPGSRCLRLLSGGRPGTILPNTAPKVGLAASTAYIATNASEEVNLKTIACDPDLDSLLYTYSTTGGRITGDGESAVWNLSGAARPGSYTVTVEVDDGCGCISFESAQVTLE